MMEDFSRRAFMGGITLTAAASVPLTEILAQPVTQVAATTPTRVSVTSLAFNDPVLQTLRQGVAILKAKPAGDPLNWTSLAQIHQNFCPHGNWYFLPWHRAYLLMYERIIRNVTGNASFALPYWDWTADRQLPPAFAQATVNGQPNPLFEASRTINPSTTLPDNMVGQTQVLDPLLSETNFEVFASTRPTNQNSTGSQWQRAPGFQGPLESNPHNRIHGAIGGVMGAFMSPLDPIFLMHHGNIDRLWAIWNYRCRSNTADPFWRGFVFAQNFRNAAGALIDVDVASMQSTVPNGYRFGLGPNLPCPGPVATLSWPPPNLRMAATPGQATAGGGANALNLRAVATIATQIAPISVANVPLAVNAETLKAAVAVPRSPGSGSVIDISGQIGRPVTPKRVIATINGIAPPDGTTTELRVYLNCDYLTVDTPTSDPHYVGTIGFFGSGSDHQGHGSHATTSAIINVTETVQRLVRLGKIDGNDLRLQLLPAPIPGRPIERVQPVRVESVDFATI